MPIDDNNPYRPPVADIAAPTPGGSAPLASHGARFAGAFIDALIAISVNLGLMFATGAFAEMTRPGGASLQTVLLWAIIGFIVYIAINGYTLATRGQSLGKLMIGTQIVSVDDGSLLSLGKIIVTRILPISVISNIPLIGGIVAITDALFIFRQDRRCLHDWIAGTKVVEYRPPGSLPTPGSSGFAA